MINLNELSLSILTILLLSLLTGVYRINRHLTGYTTGEGAWAVTLFVLVCPIIKMLIYLGLMVLALYFSEGSDREEYDDCYH